MLSLYATMLIAMLQLPAPSAQPTKLETIVEHERKRVLQAAALAIDAKPDAITHYPAPLSKGGPHDFYSNGDYWWPDPAQPDGLPYIRKDGETNPANFRAHREAMSTLRDRVAALAAAYRLTKEERYAAKAIELLDTFLLAPDTNMQPHLTYAQAIPGRSEGRGIGIIDAIHLIELPKAIQNLANAKALTPKVREALQMWFGKLKDWMRTSANGRQEAAEKNNHAIAYWLQIAVYAEFAQDTAALAECHRQLREVLLPQQMAADGSFPLELERTKPYGYSIFQMDNVATLAHVLAHHGDDPWQFALADGRSVARGTEFLTPFIADKSKWPRKPDVQAWDGWPARPVYLMFAGLALQRDDYLTLWRKLADDPVDAEVRRNRAITQPLLWLR
jgi:hypothetical protein